MEGSTEPIKSLSFLVMVSSNAAASPAHQGLHAASRPAWEQFDKIPQQLEVWSLITASMALSRLEVVWTHNIETQQTVKNFPSR